jgi:hypothetical protein
LGIVIIIELIIPGQIYNSTGKEGYFLFSR